jgi:hypothetical protein
MSALWGRATEFWSARTGVRDRLVGVNCSDETETWCRVWRLAFGVWCLGQRAREVEQQTRARSCERRKAERHQRDEGRIECSCHAQTRRAGSPGCWRAVCRGLLKEKPMPTSSEILASLELVANKGLPVAIGWHAVIVLVAFAITRGFRPSQHSAAMSLSLPLASVSVAAWVYGNPFNGAVLALGSIALAILAARGSKAAVSIANPREVSLGLLLVAFGWVYPHFLVGIHPATYLYAAPVGLLPCPTLAVVSGATLCARGLVGGPWRLTLAAIAAFYALFGLLRLHVWLDAILLLAPLALLQQHIGATTHRGAAVPR